MDSSSTGRERSRIDTGRTRKKVTYPEPAAAPLDTDSEAAGHGPHETDTHTMGAHDPRRFDASAPDYGFSLEMPESEEDNRAPASSQPSWQFWGALVGFSAAGAVVLTILSLKAG